MSQTVGIELVYNDTVVEVLDGMPTVEVILPSASLLEVVAPGPQGPVNTDYQIGGTQPTDPAIKIWYKLN